MTIVVGKSDGIGVEIVAYRKGQRDGIVVTKQEKARWSAKEYDLQQYEGRFHQRRRRIWRSHSALLQGGVGSNGGF